MFEAAMLDVAKLLSGYFLALHKDKMHPDKTASSDTP
jgi:hypothetical protein